MSYWTLAMLFSIIPEKRIAEIFRKGKVGVIDQTVGSDDMVRIGEAGNRADSLIDSYLRGHYDVPLVDGSELCESSSILTAYNLLLQSESSAIDEKYVSLQKQVMEFLKGIRDDKIVLHVNSRESGEKPKSSGIIGVVSSEREFGDNRLSQF